MPEEHVVTQAEHYKRLSRVEMDLDSLKPEVSALKTDVSYIRSSIEHMMSRQEALLQEGKQPTQWSPIIALLGLAAVVLGGYTNIVAAPLRSAIIDGAERVKVLEDSRVASAKEMGRLEGTVEALAKQLDAVDSGGSRKWNEDTK